jgi:peptide/nickel transport system substrate-binding protein
VKSLLASLICTVVAGTAQAATLRVAIDTLPPSLGNPFRTALPPSMYATAAIFDALTVFDVDAKLQPALAVRWEPVDAVTWRFYLRPNVTFHNGAPFTADAVVNAVAYIASEEANREGTKRELWMLKSARAVDDLTVDIVTSEPVPTFPRAASGLAIAEPATWRKLGREAFSRAPIGTGPFMMAAMGVTEWKLKAYPQSWRAPKLTGLNIVALPDPSSRVQGLQARRLDIAMQLSPDNIAPIEAGGDRAHVGITPSAYGFSFITTRKGPFEDVRVRRAFNLAVDRARIIEGLLDGRTVPANQPAARMVYGYDPSIPAYGYDPAAAKKLLAEAGYPNGFSFTLDAMVGAVANDAAIFQQVQTDLRAIGVNMNVTTMPSAQFLNKTQRMDFEGDAFAVAWPTWPSLDVMRAFEAHGCARAVPWFCDPSLTPLIKQAVAERDDAKALALRQKLGRAYHDAAPALFLFETPHVIGVSRKVQGFHLWNGLWIPYDQITIQ